MTGIYPGWQVVGTTIASQTAQAGLLIYGFSAIALPLEREFDTSRFEVMLSMTFLAIVSSAAAPVAGYFVDKGSVRRLMLIGSAALAAGAALVASAAALWQVWLAYALVMPLANVLLGQLTSATLVTRWFEKRRGRAMGISTIGASLGGFVFPVLIATTAQSLGWRGAFVTIGVITALLLAALIAVGVTDRPPECLQEEERADRESPPASQVPSASLTTRQIMAQSAFWIITFGVGIKLATYFGLINNLGGFADDIGVGAVKAAGLVSVLSGMSLAGKPVFGMLAERFSPRSLFIVAMVLTVASFALLSVTSSYPMLVLACLLLGLSTGGILPLWNLIVGQYFGQASFGRALGLTSMAMVPLTGAASPLAGWVHDQTGSYDAVIWGSMAVLVLATVLLVILPKPRLVESQ